MRRIVTLTMNPAVDLSAELDHVAPEKKLRCDTPRYDPGGGGVNVSRAVHKLGGESLCLFAAGGATGSLLSELLVIEGVRNKAIPIDGWTRENFIAFERSTTQQYRFGMPGPTLSEDEWRACLNELERLDSAPDYVVLSGSLSPGVPDDFPARVARRVRSMNARLVVDVSGKPLRSALDEGAYLLKPNLTELRTLSGRSLDTEEEMEDAARELVSSGKVEVVLASLGGAGAMLAWKEGFLRLRAPIVPIKSKVGAGDCTVAGMVLGLARGLAVQDAARFGVACGAAAVMTPGTELCRREDAERLYARMRVEAARE